ncbi:MAG TPA: CRISPR system precrRNA processing endoribonuclease RAMP protein Cas6 [Armatimonadota bacterium]|jgi:CRISPR/Cas system endoribonuclease Cas6 (RAMP superfamily)
MPSIHHIELTGAIPTDLYAHANGLRALVTRWIAAAAPEHPAIVQHKGQATKPYTISPLYAEGAQTCGFDLALLDDGELAQLIPEGIGRTGAAVTLGGQAYQLAGAPKAVAACSWDELVVGAVNAPEQQWAFELVTPTATSGKGKYSKQCPTLTPESYFISWAYRWTTCVPARYQHIIDLTTVEAWVETGVAVSCFNGGTVGIDLFERGRRVPFIGFVGQVMFRALPEFVEQTPHALETLTALARFAPFCGTGKDAMRGMGQTRLLTL